MQVWMTHFLSLLTYDNPLLKSQSEEAGLIEQVKSEICDNISLFAQNYGEDFADYLPKFVMSVWELLITTSLDTKYDLVTFAFCFCFIKNSLIMFQNFQSSSATLFNLSLLWSTDLSTRTCSKTRSL
jgi:hypothetical protein